MNGTLKGRKQAGCKNKIQGRMVICMQQPLFCSYCEDKKDFRLTIITIGGIHVGWISYNIQYLKYQAQKKSTKLPPNIAV